MEKILSQILGELKALRDGQDKLNSDVSALKTDVSALKTDVSTLKTDVSTLKTDVSALKTDVSALKTDVSALKTDVSTLKTDVQEVKRLSSAIFDQTADLSEFKTSTTESLGRIEKELNEIETVTAKNCFDITKLKAIK